MDLLILSDNQLITQQPELQSRTLHNEDAMKTALDGSVLVVDDCADGRRATESVLRNVGLVVETAENGQVACHHALVAIYDRRPFDLIIMEVILPVMDGYAATEFLRASGYRGRIAALTTDTSEQVREKCFIAGFDDFALKPITSEKLYDLARRNLKAHSLAAQSRTTRRALAASR